MRTPRSVALVLLGIIVDCAAARVFSVPLARAGTTPQRWEYACTDAFTEEATPTLNKYGQEGWEMAGMTTPAPLARATFCFKRALP
jgi:hypothetical protein